MKKQHRSAKAYLTKRLLARAARAGIRKAAKKAMDIMGYTVVVDGDWVVKKFADGTIEKLKQLPQRVCKMNCVRL
jgi:hypothetical protein